MGAILGLLAFAYQKIDWTWSDGGISSGDDWEARV
jgi:hypothetical protein